MNNESRFSAFAHTFKYRSPLWIESDSDISKSGSDRDSGSGRGLNSDESLECSSNSSDSINNFLDKKVVLVLKTLHECFVVNCNTPSLKHVKRLIFDSSNIDL